MSSCLASSTDASEWQVVDTRRLPRHAFHRVIAFAGHDGRDAMDAFAELVSLRNALTPTGSLLLVLPSPEVANDLHDLATRAGFTRMRELTRSGRDFSTIELKR